MHALVHAADIQDRDGGVVVMATLFGLYPFLLKLYADGGYQGRAFQAGLKKAIARVNVEIVKRSDQARGFVVLPKRWIVERTPHPELVEGRLAGTMPPSRQGLGVPQRQGARILEARIDPPHDQKAMQSIMKSPDRL